MVMALIRTTTTCARAQLSGDYTHKEDHHLHACALSLLVLGLTRMTAACI
jgi:hypothetical protein